jgi:hypothetical protein
VRLRGLRRAAPPSRPLFDPDRPAQVHACAPHAAEPPALDGTFDGLDGSEPLLLDYEDQYRRSEEPYPGAEEFSATAVVNWDADALYLGVDVVKPEVITGRIRRRRCGSTTTPTTFTPTGFRSISVRSRRTGLRLSGRTGGDDGDPVRARRNGGARMVTGRRRAVSRATPSPSPSRCRDGTRAAATSWASPAGELDGARPERRSGQLVWSGGGG